MTIRQRSILVGAAVTGILSTSYFSFVNALCCLGVILGGIVAVQQFTSMKGPAIASGDGAIIGALSGALGAVLGAIFDAVLRPVGLDSNTISREMMEEWMSQMEGQQGMSPEMMEQMQGEGGMAVMLVGVIVTMVIYAIFGAVGGAVGVALFGEEPEEP